MAHLGFWLERKHNLRVHKVDFRFSSSQSMFRKRIVQFDDLFKKNIDEKNLPELLNVIQDLVLTIKIIDLKKYHFTKTEKQLNAITDRESADTIKKYYDVLLYKTKHQELKYMHEVVNNSKACVNDDELSDDEKLGYLKSQYELLDLLIVPIEATYMDTYLTARLFRSYQDDAPDATHVFIYTGNAHSERYRNFLTSIGFTTNFSAVSEEKGKNFQCISLKGIQLPFFSAQPNA